MKNVIIILIILLIGSFGQEVLAGEQKELDNLCQKISQEEANSIDKDTLKKMFLECGSILLLKTIIRTEDFSNDELFKMADQSKYPFDAFNALYLCDVISWETFGRMWNAHKRRR